ncbi:MAG: TlyA family RNA methyltransferase [Deltaproteobacteria bacterium]|nr:TlyA family RNA methyltransferase [Deltaproteobacteria bacterium]
MRRVSQRRPEISAERPENRKWRLDKLMFQKGLVETREKARAMIMAGLVYVDDRKAVKAGHFFSESASIHLKEPEPPFVSRGGLKLEGAIKHFSMNVESLVLLDVGASTGGFTDCLLKRGAERIIAIDVGYGQFAWKLRQDPRVTVLEKTNIRYVTPDKLDVLAQGAVIDVSFISLKLVIPPVSRLLRDHAFIMALIKPQFEAGKGKIGKGGVVRDPAVHESVIADLTGFCETSEWSVQGVVPSALLGPKGNREFFIYLTR